MESLDALVNLIVTGVSDIKQTYAKESASIPSLDEPYVPTQAEALSMQTIDTVVAAALHLVAALRPAPVSVLSTSLGMFETASLGSASRFNIAEILREAGSEGLHIREIGEKAGTSPDKIGRILRYLASHHIFKEVAPDVFANNRLSSVLDSGKSAQQNFAEPLKKHEQSSGLPAMVEHMADESFKAAAHIPDFLSEKSMAFSDEPSATPFNLAYKTSDLFWDWCAKPENELMQVRFSAAMNGTKRLFPANLILERYPWSSLSNGSLVVDVGGGIGSSTLVLAKQFPNLKFVVQDLPQTIKDGQIYWKSEYPEALANGLVELQDHDFFKPQPIQNAAIFMLRVVLHDWSTTYAKKILSQLRSAAQPHTKVVIVEQILPNLVGSDTHKTTFDFTTTEPPARPFPLLPGTASIAYSADLQMFSMCNGKERTVGGWVETVEGTGWKISEIIYGPLSSVILIPM